MDRATSRTRRLGIALGLNVVLAAAQIAGGLVAHSVGLLSDAGHNVTDVAGVAVSLVAVRWALRPPSPERSFGYHRGPILAALANAAVIAVVTAAIVAQSIVRLVHPHAVHGGLVVVVAAFAFVVNGLAALMLHDRTGDLNMRSAALHMAGDALGSLAVLGAGAVLVLDASAVWVDPAASLVVAVVIVAEAVRLLRASVEVLLESAPADVDLRELTATMGGVPGVAEVHDLHVWSLSSEVRALSAHLVLSGHPTLEEAQVVGERVKAAIGVPFTIAHSTLELECERCTDVEIDPCLMDGVVETRGAPSA
ncbi:MAG TPA: cation diffusion facilitator family transporter [Acidimicrobiales bacterium]|nr:cation diffusion facilitator family transporter [Acidimicrobiales bacterium]